MWDGVNGGKWIGLELCLLVEESRLSSYEVRKLGEIIVIFGAPIILAA